MIVIHTLLGDSIFPAIEYHRIEIHDLFPGNIIYGRLHNHTGLG